MPFRAKMQGMLSMKDINVLYETSEQTILNANFKDSFNKVFVQLSYVVPLVAKGTICTICQLTMDPFST